MENAIAHSTTGKLKRQVILVLRVLSVLVLLGRGWQHLFWDIPIRSLLWDEALLKGLVSGLFNVEWKAYVTSTAVDSTIKGVTRFFGLFYVLAAGLAMALKPDITTAGKVLVWASVGLFFLAILSWKENFYRLGMLIEHASQFSLPFLLYLLLFSDVGIKRVVLLAKIAVALTFVGHGLYAIGYYPRPGVFIDMIINIMYVSEQSANYILLTAGILDMLVAVFIFIPSLVYPALWYALIWGTLTALARIVSYISFDFFSASLHQWLFETIYRFSHMGLPLVILMMRESGQAVRKWGSKKLSTI